MFASKKSKPGLPLGEAAAAARRASALAKQRKARVEAVDRARALLDSAGDPPAATPAAAAPAAAAANLSAAAPPGASRKRARHWASQLSQPEWLATTSRIPLDLNGTMTGDAAEGWLVRPRPPGEVVLVVAAAGMARARNCQGVVVDSFCCALPGGSPGSRGRDSGTILEAILDADARTYHVTDVMAWNGVDFYGCTFDLRHFFAGGKLADLPPAAPPERRFLHAPAFECDRAGCACHSLPSLCRFYFWLCPCSQFWCLCGRMVGGPCAVTSSHTIFHTHHSV